MYASRTVCSRCSSQLRLAAAQRLGNRALYASQADAQNTSQPPSSTSNETEPHHATFGQRPRFAQKPFEAENDPALALFNDIVSHAAVPEGSKGVSRPALGELEIAGKINELMKKERLTVDKQYEIFENTMWPHVLQISGRVPKSVFMAALQFLGEVRDSIIQETIKADSLELCRKISRLGRYNLDFRNDLIVALCFRLMKELKNPDSTETAALLDELVKLWKHVSQLKRLGEVDQELRFMLPSAEEVLKDVDSHRDAKMGKAEMHRTTKALSSIFLQYPPEQARQIMPALVASLAVLSDPKVASTGALEEMAPLLNLVGVAMNRSRPDNRFIGSAFGVRSRVPLPTQSWIRSYIKNNWSRIKRLVSQDGASWSDGVQVAHDPANKHVVKISTFHSQLRTAYQAQNIGAVMSIWQSLNSRMELHPELAEQIKKDPEFMEYWVYVWCAIRRTHMVQETLQLMTKLGMEPTIKTYTAMMHGWKMCKDSRKIELLWKQLLNSGMKLDIVIHTERISSLIESGKPQQGIQALVAMVNDWKQALKEGRPDKAVKPTIEVVNAAFQGLIQRDAQAAHQVLAWAGGEGFVPNIRTYNILLRESLRSGNPGDVQELFAAMKKQDIEPDAATFTITLEEVLGRMGDADSAEQVQAVEQVFTDIEFAGLKPNMEMYGKMLYAVAYLANGSDEAIASVQNHMLRNGFKITPHMVTILIQRALSRDPPDISAVRDLLQKHRLKHVGQGDQTLWERVMSAFAIAGEREQALKIFNELADAGRPVTSLPCLLDLLKVLLAHGDYEHAKHVVTVVLSHKGTEEEFKERYWKHHFWFLAKQNRLVTVEQAPHLFEARD